MNSHEAPTGITRRQLTTASAWALPIVIAAAAAPLAAATGNIEITMETPWLFDEVVETETVGLTFYVTQGGSPYTGVAGASLGEASGIARWSVDGEDPIDSAYMASAVYEGYLTVVAYVDGDGQFTVLVSVLGEEKTFAVQFGPS